MQKRRLSINSFAGWLTYPLRLRTSKGFGVHSPFAFRLIREVIEERLPYYDYAGINRMHSDVSCESLRLLYRVAARFSAMEFIFLGNPDSKMLRVMQLAAPSKKIMINPEGECPESSLVVVDDPGKIGNRNYPPTCVLYLKNREMSKKITPEILSKAMIFNSKGASVVVLRRNLPGNRYNLI